MFAADMLRLGGRALSSGPPPLCMDLTSLGVRQTELSCQTRKQPPNTRHATHLSDSSWELNTGSLGCLAVFLGGVRRGPPPPDGSWGRGDSPAQLSSPLRPHLCKSTCCREAAVHGQAQGPTISTPLCLQVSARPRGDEGGVCVSSNLTGTLSALFSAKAGKRVAILPKKVKVPALLQSGAATPRPQGTVADPGTEVGDPKHIGAIADHPPQKMSEDKGLL